MLTLGSLFDGSGGFPLAGSLHGIKPLWASEIEPYPIRVTKARFPEMKHLGSVLDINGAEIEPVDIVTFGSPCQDLSVAGKQLGIHNGERSNLFFEAIRIAKEMREHDRAAGRADVDLRPRFLVWKNVPGAFSSNQGEDFRAVIEALGGIAQDGLSIPRPAKGKWNHAGCVVGDGWSIAWRVYDAQYWGVPQRRKRIYLIADLASERAGEILFERESVCGHPSEGGETRQGTAEDAEGCAGGSGCAVYDTTQITSPLNYSNPKPGDPCHPLAARQHPPLTVYGISSYHSNAWKSSNPYSGVYEADVAKTLDLNGGNPACNQGGAVVVALQGNGIDRHEGAGCQGKGWRENVCYTLNTIDRPAFVYDARGNGGGRHSADVNR